MRIATGLLFASLALGVGLGSACSSSSSPPVQSGPGDAGPDAAPVAEAGLPPLETRPPALIPAAERKDASSAPVVFDPLRGGVWTANGDVGTVSYVDIDKGALLREIRVGGDVRSVALSPDAAWVAAVDRDGASVSLIAADAKSVARAIPVGTHPRAAVWDPTNPRWLYVSLEDDGAIGVIDRTLGVYTKTIPVGRLPAGLAVSRLRHELYVAGRVDGNVTTVSLDSLAVSRTLKLADEPADPAPTTPQGKPFALESLAFAADGTTMWVPHELLAPTHPFQFQQTVFPAVSVLDYSGPMPAEVATDPNDPNGVIAGRKLLFGAIDVFDATGNTAIVSQPCGVAMHPNGLVAYVVACGSEDLLTFDVTSGAETSMLRNLPGDHPAGIALDDTGQRAFVVSDQSHTLVRIDVAAGDITKEVHVIGGAIPLVAKDPVDPQLRAGLTLFYRANSSKGTLATTGNDWMSCGACHLDGFVSTNQFLFEASKVKDPTVDAQIGHVSLADLFSTSPTPTDPSFNPHDILVALNDMGGLAPDRSGALRAGSVDPSAPTPEATVMAAQLARVIARDLPVGPSWFLSPGDKPNPAYDGAWCGSCHQAEYAAWKKSAHAHSAEDKMVLFGMGVEQKLRGAQYSRLCAGCHDPVNVRLGDTTLASPRSITCLGCHDAERLIRAGGNADLQSSKHVWEQDHKAAGIASLARLRSPDFCGGCHQQFVPGSGLGAIETLAEYHASPYATPSKNVVCVDCHMAKNNGVADHRAVGGNVYMGTLFGDAAFVSDLEADLASAIKLAPSRNSDGSVTVTVANRGAGHAFPTGVTDIREPWVELQAVDGGGKVIARYGGPDPTGLIPATAARFGMDIAKPDGTVLYQHELSQATRIPFSLSVPALGSVDVKVTPDPQLPAGATELDAVLLYRNVRTPYYRAATGDATSSSPEVEVARAKVQ